MEENVKVRSSSKDQWEQFEDDSEVTIATRETTPADNTSTRELTDDVLAQAFPEIIIKQRRKMESDTDSDFDWANDPFAKRVISSPVMKSKNGNSRAEISTTPYQRTDSFEDSSYGSLRIGFNDQSHVFAESRQLDFSDENSLKNEVEEQARQSFQKSNCYDSNSSFDSCTSSDGHDGHPETRRTKDTDSTDTRRNLPRIEQLILHRLPGEKLGMILGVEGGKENNEKVRAVVVRSVTTGGAAERASGGSRGIVAGDRILEINGLNLHTLSHNECITVFKEMPLQVIMTVKRAKLKNNVSQKESFDYDTADILTSPPKGFTLHDFLIQKARTEPLGLSIVPSYGTTKNYYQVKRLLASGPSAKSGQLQVGDRLIAYNNTSLRNLVQSECMSVLRQSCAAVNFRILRPNNKGRRLRISVTKSGVREIPGYSSDLDSTSDPTDTDTADSRTTSGSEDNDGSNSDNLADHSETVHPLLATDVFGRHQFKLDYGQSNSSEAPPDLYDTKSFLRQEYQPFHPHGLNMEKLLSENPEKSSELKMSSSDLDFLASLDTLKSDEENFVQASHIPNDNSFQTSNGADLLLDFGDATIPTENRQGSKPVRDQSDLEPPSEFADIPGIAPYRNADNQNGYTDIWDNGFGESNFISESDNDVPVTNIDDLIEDSGFASQVLSSNGNGPTDTLLDFEVLQTNGPSYDISQTITNTKMQSNDHVEVPLLVTQSETEVEHIFSGRSSGAIDKPEDGSISPFSSHSGSTVIHRAGSAFEDTDDTGDNNGVLDKSETRVANDLLHVTTVQVQSEMQNFPDLLNGARGEHVSQVSVNTSNEPMEVEVQPINLNIEESVPKIESTPEKNGVVTLYLDGSDNSQTEFLSPEPAIVEDVIIQSKGTHQTEAAPSLEDDSSIIAEQVSRNVEINLDGATEIPKSGCHNGDKAVLPVLVENLVEICKADDRKAIKRGLSDISQAVEEETIIPAEKGSVLNAEYSQTKGREINYSDSNRSFGDSDLIIPVKVPRRSPEEERPTDDEHTKVNRGENVSQFVDSLVQNMETREANTTFGDSEQRELEKDITEDSIIPISISRATESTPSQVNQANSFSQRTADVQTEEIVSSKHIETESTMHSSNEETIVPVAAPRRSPSRDAVKSTVLEKDKQESLPQLADNLLADLNASEKKFLSVINTESKRQEVREENIVPQEKKDNHSSQSVNVTDQLGNQTPPVLLSSVDNQENIVAEVHTDQQTVLTRQNESTQKHVDENIVPTIAPRRSTTPEGYSSRAGEKSYQAVPHFVDNLVADLDKFEKKTLAVSDNKSSGDVINEEEIFPISKQLIDAAPTVELNKTESAKNDKNLEKTVLKVNQSSLDDDIQTTDSFILDTSIQSLDSVSETLNISSGDDSLNSSTKDFDSFSKASFNLPPALSPLPDTPPVRKLPSIKAFTAKGFTPVKLNSLGSSPIKTVSLDRRITTKLSSLNTSPLTGLNLQTSSQSQIKVTAMQTRSQDGPFQIDLLKGILGLGMKVNRNSDGSYQVSEIQKSSSVDKNGNIRVADYVLSINGTELMGLPDTKVQQILRLLPRGIAKVVFSVQPDSERTNGETDNLKGTYNTTFQQKSAPVIQSVKAPVPRMKISEKSETLAPTTKWEGSQSDGRLSSSVIPVMAATYAKVVPQREFLSEKEETQTKQISVESSLPHEKETLKPGLNFELTSGDKIADNRSETSEPSSLSEDSLLASTEIEVFTQKNDDGDSAISISSTSSTPASEAPSLKIEEQIENDANKPKNENLKPPPVKPRTKSWSSIDRSAVSDINEAHKMKKVEEWQLSKSDDTEEAVSVTAYPVMVRPSPSPAPRVPRSPTTHREPPPVSPRTRTRKDSSESNSSSKRDIEPLEILDPVFKPSSVAKQFGTVKSPMSRKMSGLIDKFKSFDSEPESPGSDAVISPRPHSDSVSSASPSREPRNPFSFPLKEEPKSDAKPEPKTPPKVAPKPKRRSGEIVYQPVLEETTAVLQSSVPTRNPPNDDDVVVFRKKTNFLRRDVQSETPSFVLSAARAQGASKDSSSDFKLGYRPRSAETVFSIRTLVASSAATRLKGLQIPSKLSQKPDEDNKATSTLQINPSKLAPALRPRSGPAAFTRIQPKIHKISPKLNLAPIKLNVNDDRISEENLEEVRNREEVVAKRLSSSSSEGFSPRMDSAGPSSKHETRDIQQTKTDSFKTKFPLQQSKIPDIVSLETVNDTFKNNQVKKELKELEIYETTKNRNDTKTEFVDLSPVKNPSAEVVFEKQQSKSTILVKEEPIQHSHVVNISKETIVRDSIELKENVETESDFDLEITGHTSSSHGHGDSDPVGQFHFNTGTADGVDVQQNLEATPVLDKFADTMSSDVIDVSVTTASDLINDDRITNEYYKNFNNSNNVQQSDEKNRILSNPYSLSEIQEENNTEQKNTTTCSDNYGAKGEIVDNLSRVSDFVGVSVERENGKTKNNAINSEKEPVNCVVAESERVYSENSQRISTESDDKKDLQITHDDAGISKSTPQLQMEVSIVKIKDDKKEDVLVKSENSVPQEALPLDLTSGRSPAGLSVIITKDVSEDAEAPPDLPQSLPPPLPSSPPPDIPSPKSHNITTQLWEVSTSMSTTQQTLPLALKRHQSVKPPTPKASSTELEVGIEFVPTEQSSPNALFENKQLLSDDMLDFSSQEVSTSTPARDSQVIVETLGESPVSTAHTHSLFKDLENDQHRSDLKIPPPSFEETPSPQPEKVCRIATEQTSSSELINLDSSPLSPSSPSELKNQNRPVELENKFVDASNSTMDTSSLSASIQQANTSTLSVTSQRKWTFISNRSDQSLLSASPNTSVSLDHSECSLLPPEELASLLDKANETLDETDKKEEEEILVVLLHKDIGEKVGLSFKSTPRKDIMISDVDTRSTAGKDGRILVNDQLLSINGKPVVDRSPHEARVMLRTSKDQVVLVLARSPCPKSDKDGSDAPTTTTEPSARRRLRSTSQERKKALIEANDNQKNSSSESVKSSSFETSRSRRSPRSSVSPDKTSLPSSPLATAFPTSPVERDTSKMETSEVIMIKGVTGLGFCLEGGKGSPLGDRPVLIKRLFKGGAADKCGLLQEKDEILEVNGKSFQELRHYEAWNYLKFLPDGDVKLLIRR